MGAVDLLDATGGQRRASPGPDRPTEDETTKAGALDARLASIEGHVRGVRKMLEEGAYCVNVLKQTFAVERALKRFEGELLRRHLWTCVPQGIREGRDADMARELGDLFDLARK